jgi:hypothetical protein
MGRPTDANDTAVIARNANEKIRDNVVFVTRIDPFGDRRV